MNNDLDYYFVYLFIYFSISNYLSDRFNNKCTAIIYSMNRITSSSIKQYKYKSFSLKSCFLLNEQYINETSLLIHNAFPLTSLHSWGRALDLKENNLQFYLQDYLKTTINRSYGLSLHNNIYDNNTSIDALSGVIISEIQQINKMKHEELYHNYLIDATEYKPYDAIEGILMECNNIFYKELNKRNYVHSNYGYISWIATNEKDRNKGIASRLLETCTESLQYNDQCLLSVAYCVSPKATKVFLLQNYSIWGQLSYHSYEYKGKKPFHILPDEISIVVKEFKT